MWSEPTPAVTQSLRFFACEKSVRARSRESTDDTTYLLYEFPREITRVERRGDEDLGL